MLNFRDFSIKKKLTTITLSICCTVLMLTSGIYSAFTLYSFRDHMIRDISLLADVSGISSTAALTFQDKGAANEILSALSVEKYVVAAFIYLPDDEVFAKYTNIKNNHISSFDNRGVDHLKESIDFIKSVGVGYRFSSNYLDLVRPVILNNKSIGKVHIRVSLENFYHNIKVFSFSIICIMLVLFLVSYLMSAKLQHIISRPILELEKIMKQVSHEKIYSIRAQRQGNDEIGILIDGFNEMLSQIQEQDSQLKHNRDRLEERVVERTCELRQANEDLKIEMAERKRAEEDKSRLEKRLFQAQKMEAIGTLAGGVAHDLNNVLSGLVSYPDLLLMQIPEDSPLRNPVLTIKKSGEKAAAIVQDLLTLARRGVPVTEVVNLNDIIKDFLVSTELLHCKSFHPKMDIITHLEPDLLNIIGSPVHLSKTILNLVTNAAESMPEGGVIGIVSENRYIDRPVKGYDDVVEGDYAVITVSDSGIGINKEDLRRIFEPFYTKKVMGRSGTGLGMAVVWGTVKDSKGYIDVHSSEGNGTRFSLYFPVTRESLRKETTSLNIDDYMGHGESILVVDDVEDQREIASRMLKKLGYSVKSVPSGEDACEYMKDHSVDLLILDMIMDPGIDGFDTYKRIKEYHPGQKAIITSGFSETYRVKDLQNLGAGAYIKKPYLLEKIGLAVRYELDKKV